MKLAWIHNDAEVEHWDATPQDLHDQLVKKLDKERREYQLISHPEISQRAMRMLSVCITQVEDSQFRYERHMRERDENESE